MNKIVQETSTIGLSNQKMTVQKVKELEHNISFATI